MTAGIADIRDFGSGMGVGNVAADNAGFANMFATLPAGDMVYIPYTPDGFNVDDDFTRSTAIKMVGSGIYGAGGAVINYGGDGAFLTLDGGGGGSGSRLQDFRIVGSDDAQAGIYINGTFNAILLDKLFIEEFGEGAALRLSSAWSVMASKCTFRYSEYGVYCDTVGASHVVNNLALIGNDIVNNVHGIFLQSGAGAEITGNDFSGTADVAIDLANGLQEGPNHQLKGVRIGYNYCEGGTYVRIGHGANASMLGSITDTIIDGGYLDCTDDYYVLGVCQNTTIRTGHIGAIRSGKKSIRIGDDALNTHISGPVLDPAAVVDDGENTLYAPNIASRAQAHMNGTNQALASNTYTKVALSHESLDRLGEYDAANRRFTAKRKGWLNVHAQVACGPMAAGKFINVSVWKNGAPTGGIRECNNDVYAPVNGVYPSASVSKQIYFNVGDYIEVYAIQNDTVSRTILGDTAFSFLSITA